LKNAHLLRYPAASPSRRRGKKSLLIRRDATPHPSPCQSTGQACCSVHSGTPHFSGEFILSLSKEAPCICLPARSRFGGGRGIFDQPEKNEFFDTLLSLEFYGFLWPLNEKRESENEKALPQLWR
jgi:hypothetical protein